MKKLLSTLLVSAVLCASALAESVPKVQKALPFSKGINMPVWLEGSRLNTLLYNKKDFENIKSLGVEVVRLPVWFEIWNQGAPDYKIEGECFEMIDKAASWCEELGMFLIIDFHNDCDGKSKTNPKIEQVLLKVWPQVAERYKDKGDFLIYEVMNEPHFKSGNLQADCAKWAKIQGKVLKAIRAVDPGRLVVVGGGDWNSLDSMLKLPDYGDQNLIYNFHDYTPFLFTHQGAGWTNLKRLKNIPFPYDKKKMPPLPKGADDAERWEWNGYSKAADLGALKAPLDKAVEFANKRKAALMCDEFGVLMTYADPSERANWYRLKCGWMDERGIIRASWDYIQEFGLFKSPGQARFPQDLNAPLLEAMGYKIPSGDQGESWLENAQKSGDWTIYQNGSAGVLRAQGYGAQGSTAFAEDGQDQACVRLKEIAPYGNIAFSFGEPCDFTELAESGARLEFEIKTNDKTLAPTVYFRDSESKIFPWRAAAKIKAGGSKADGQWRAASIPLKRFMDAGGWSNASGWKNGEGKFSWALVDALVFENGESASKEGYSIRAIRIVAP